jgi:hypothetical protein
MSEKKLLQTWVKPQKYEEVAKHAEKDNLTIAPMIRILINEALWCRKLKERREICKKKE